VVGLVAVQLRIDLGEPGREVLLLEAQAQAVAPELRAVHAPAAVAGPAVARAGAQLQPRVGVGRQAHGRVGVPFVPGRRYAPALAVFVILAVRMVGRDAYVHPLAAGFQVGVLVVAAGAGAQQAGAQMHIAGAEVGPLAVEQHHPGRGAGPHSTLWGP
jgi:hypothetical protein